MIDDLPRDHPLPELIDVVVVTFVEKNTTKWKAARARKEIRQMVNKLLRRENFGKFWIS